MCQDLFDNVVETPCCHRCYCKHCIGSWLEKGKTCPDCRRELKIDDCRSNLPLQRMTDNVPSTCPYLSLGCKDKVTRGTLKEHINKCDYAEVSCNNSDKCNKMYLKDRPNHLRNCEYRKVPCNLGCGEEVPLNIREDHLKTCTHQMQECTLGCGATILRKDIAAHRAEVCPLAAINCNFSKFGCKEKVKRNKIKEHMIEVEYHYKLFEQQINDKDEENKLMLDKISLLQREVFHLQEAIQRLSILKPKLPYNPMKDKPLILPTLMRKENDQSLVVDGRLVQYKAPLFSSIQKAKNPIIVRADIPVTPCGGLYYFEITVESAGKDGAIGIGFYPVIENPILTIMPGWQFGSFGYHGDDGKKFCDKTFGQGDPYGPPYGNGDTVGCAWDQVKGTIYFVLNGNNLGVAFEKVPSIPFWPVVGIHTLGAKVNVNFGLDPFKFKLDDKV